MINRKPRLALTLVYSSILIYICFIFYISTATAGGKIHFSKKKIRVATTSLVVEIADTPEKSAHGLMYRTSLKDGTGMLFIFPEEAFRNFWMKNTFVALSIGYFDRKGKLVDIQNMSPVKSEMEMNPPTYPSQASAMYALEVPQGWFERNKIKLGAVLKID